VIVNLWTQSIRHGLLLSIGNVTNQGQTQMTEREKLLLTIEESARLLGLGRSKFYTEVLSGRCESVKVGKRRLVPLRSLESYVERLLQESGSPASSAHRQPAAARGG
jgi:putative molybdopterin biosynthesis protein